MSVRVKVIFYSLHGHVYRMAEAVAAGAREVKGAQVELLQVAETLPKEILEKMGAVEAKKAFAHIPIADPKKLPEADAILLGTGTRFGSATAQM
ncbi:MAG: NAD(P)H:quinone oxidoreductase, partial [Opitutaceae bacterium]